MATCLSVSRGGLFFFFFVIFTAYFIRFVLFWFHTAQTLVIVVYPFFFFVTYYGSCTLDLTLCRHNRSVLFTYVLLSFIPYLFQPAKRTDLWRVVYIYIELAKMHFVLCVTLTYVNKTGWSVQQACFVCMGMPPLPYCEEWISCCTLQCFVLGNVAVPRTVMSCPCMQRQLSWVVTVPTGISTGCLQRRVKFFLKLRCVKSSPYYCAWKKM